MQYRRVGSSGLKVSTVSLGSWLTYGNAVDDALASACVQQALELGINFFDTADIYAKGKAEEVLGKALDGRRREHLVLATKLFWPMSEDPNDRGLSRKHIMESCHQSLRRLRTSYLDLYQCHRHDPDVPMAEVVRAMDDLIRQGKVLYWGVSCWTAAQIEEAVRAAQELGAHPPISNQPPYNLLERDIEREVIPTSERLGVGQVVFSPLAQGLLTGKYKPGQAPPAGTRLANDRLNTFMKDRAGAHNLERIERLAEIARDLDRPLAAVALAWCLRKGNVSSVIVGATRPEQLAENARAVEVQLDPDALRRIEAALG